MCDKSIRKETNKMLETLKPTYDFYWEKYEKLNAELISIKKMLNSLAKDMEIDLPFQSFEDEDVVKSSFKIKAGQFYNMPLTKAVIGYLTMRGFQNAAQFDEIIKALEQGGYSTARIGKAEANRIRQNIIKNTAYFSLVGDNIFGLKEWYPEKIKKTAKEIAEEITNEPNMLQYSLSVSKLILKEGYNFSRACKEQAEIEGVQESTIRQGCCRGQGLSAQVWNKMAEGDINAKDSIKKTLINNYKEEESRIREVFKSVGEQKGV